MSLEQKQAATGVDMDRHANPKSEPKLRVFRDPEGNVGPLQPQFEPWHAVCNSIAWNGTIDLADRYAQTNDPVVIVGEYGTGKRYLTDRMSLKGHANGLMRISCGKLASELATGGERVLSDWQTLANKALLRSDLMWWLDSIDELPIEFQPLLVELIRNIQDRHNCELSIVCTVARPLFELLESNRIREDVYYSLAVHELQVPALRERPCDILALTNLFSTDLSGDGRPMRFSHQAMDALHQYEWPGNVTELRNLIARVRVRADRSVVDIEQLLTAWNMRRRQSSDFSTLNLEEAETRLIIRAVERSGGNKTAAAKQLGITARTLHNKMQKYKSLGLVKESA